MKKIQRYSVFFCTVFVFFTAFSAAAQENGTVLKVNPDIKSIEISVSDVDIFISPSPSADTVISYKLELLENTALSVTRNGKYLKFTELLPARGSLYIYVPKSLLLESCRIQAVNAKIEVTGIKSVYFAVSAIKSSVKVDGTRFKNVLAAVADGEGLTFKSGIVSVADFAVSKTAAVIDTAEEEAVCNLFISGDSETGITFKGEALGKRLLSVSPPKPKKFIAVNFAFSTVALNFIAPLKEPEEKFDVYGISEFGPKRPPQTDGPSRFLPRPAAE